MRGVRTLAWVPLILLLLAGSPSASSQEDGPGISLDTLFPGAVFAPSVPSQEEVLGFPPAARPMRHAELVRYLETLAEVSPRASIDVYAVTHEGRPMIRFAVGDERRIADLEAFRADHARRLDPRGRPAAADEGVLADAPAVAWMAYGIHGDELSSSDAAAALAYRLVAGEDEATRRLRRDVLVLIDPCENPDGRERFLAQTSSFAHTIANPDTEDLSHTTVWPWGRGNHYLFDLNRDWFTMIQPESRRAAVLAAWNPQLVVDSHEMGPNSSYLFSPARHPFNPYLPPTNMDWAQRFAADQARALDARGYPYYTREWNEEFFPGYGSSWASYIGAIGILYEMSGTEGTLVRQRGAGVRTFPQAVEHQVTSSVANLTTLLEHRAEILRDEVADRRKAMAASGKNGPAAWLLPRGRYAERTDHLVDLLRAQGIEVLRNAGTVSPAGLRDACTGAAVERSFEPGSVWMVSLAQPAAPLVRNLLDPHVPMGAEFLREEREYQERGKGTRLYEVTAWSLPLSFAVEALWTGTMPGGDWQPAEPETVEGALEDAPGAVAYLLDGGADAAMPALVDLMRRGVQVRVAEKPFRVGDEAWDRGTLLVRREGNPDDVERRLAEVADRFHVRIVACSTAKAIEGPDLGGDTFHPLVQPRIGVWTGWPVSPGAYGAIWHLLDEDLWMRFNALDLGRFGRVDLDRYNVLVFPPAFGGPRGYHAAIGDAGIDRLKTWVEGGGTAIGIGNGATFLADPDLGLTRTRMRSDALETYPPVVIGIGADEAAAAGAFRAAGIRAPESESGDDDHGKPGAARKTPPPAPHRESPYDVAPMIGPGAMPFTRGVELGTPVSMTPVDLATWMRPLLPPGQVKPEKEDLARADQRLRRFAPRGAFLRVELDPEVWLNWGLPGELPVLTRAGDALVAEPPVQVAARFADVERLHLGGLLWPEAAGRLARTAYATREGKGRGQVILFLDEPGFREWTLGTRRLLINALLYGPGLGTRWPTPW